MRSKPVRRVPRNSSLYALVREKQKWGVPLPRDWVRKGFLGWHEAGYLPHVDRPGLVQFVTFRLADAFPAELRAEWQHLVTIESNRARRVELENYLDRGRGKCWLRQSEISAMVEQALVCFEGERYELRAWVVMPNHVHALFRVWAVPMWKVVESWKTHTAKEANRRLGRGGRFWQKGYWDTYMRDRRQEDRARRYVEGNPVKVGLVPTPEAWAWSSARFRDRFGRLCLPENL
jgi:REP element-mobilizing transposase RayT